MDLKGKAAIVTGSSSDGGIGAECAKILASRGCNVVVNYATNKAGAEKVAADCAAAGVKAFAGSRRRGEGRRLRPAGQGGGRTVRPARRADQQRRGHQADPAAAHGPARCRRVRAHLLGQPDRQLPDVPRRGAASQGERRRGDRQHLVDRRHARQRQLDRLFGLEGRAQHAHLVDGAAAGAGGAGERALSGRACSATGRRRS